MRKILVAGALAGGLLLSGVGVTAASATAAPNHRPAHSPTQSVPSQHQPHRWDRDDDRCRDRATGVFLFQEENVRNAPGTRRRVVSVDVLEQLVVEREFDWRLHRCVTTGRDFEPVYRDAGRRHRAHLVLRGRYTRPDRGEVLNYWKFRF